jgi:hypothetical protein
VPPGDGDGELDSLLLGLTDGDGELEMLLLGETDGDTEDDGLTEADGDTDGLTELDGEPAATGASAIVAACDHDPAAPSNVTATAPAVVCGNVVVRAAPRPDDVEVSSVEFASPATIEPLSMTPNPITPQPSTVVVTLGPTSVLSFVRAWVLNLWGCPVCAAPVTDTAIPFSIDTEPVLEITTLFAPVAGAAKLNITKEIEVVLSSYSFVIDTPLYVADIVPDSEYFQTPTSKYLSEPEQVCENVSDVPLPAPPFEYASIATAMIVPTSFGRMPYGILGTTLSSQRLIVYNCHFY